MKIVVIYILTCYAALATPESYFFWVEKAVSSKIEDGILVDSYSIRKFEINIKMVEAYYQGLGKGRTYQIEIHAPEVGFKAGPPYLKLKDDILRDIKYLGDAEGKQSMTIESDDRKKIEKWVKELQRLSGLPDAKIILKLDQKAETGSSDAGKRLN